MNWKIYLLEDKPARHALMGNLVTTVNAQAGRGGGEHQFESGFPNGKPVVDASTINTALDDPRGIWLVDLDIPQGIGVGPVEDIGGPPPAGTFANIELAYRVIGVLQARQRPFVVISSGSLPGNATRAAEQAIGVEGISFDEATHLPEVSNAILARVVPDRIYKRAFDEALERLNRPEYHAGANGGVPVCMFPRGNTPPLHNLGEWDVQYPVNAPLPLNEAQAIESVLTDLMRVWKLKSTVLSAYPITDRGGYWWLPAAKAVNSLAIHRAFVFGLAPQSVAQDCLPSLRRILCLRDRQLPHLGVLGLQALIKTGGHTDGFDFAKLADWNLGADCGIQIELHSRRNGCDARQHFENVLTGAWQPNARNGNGQEMSRALKHIRDIFITDGSSVNCTHGRLEVVLRIKERALL